MTFFRGRNEDVQDAFIEQGILYGISIGRRAPMHRVHVDCLREIEAAGLLPVIVIGSTNSADSRLFDPVRNPMTVAQQIEQLKLALPDLFDAHRIILQDDLGDDGCWYDELVEKLKDAGLERAAVVHYRSKKADANATGEVKTLSAGMKDFEDRGLHPWESFNRDPADDDVNASDIRNYNLECLTPDQRQSMSTPDYIITLARQARADNPDRDLLRMLPLTVFDLTLERYRKEAGISTAEIIARAELPYTTCMADAARAIFQERLAAAEQSAPKRRMVSKGMKP